MRFPRPSFTNVCLFSGVLFMAATLLSQAPSPAPSPAPTLSEITSLRLSDAYKEAILAQQTKNAADVAYNRAMADWNEVNAQARKDEKLPDGTVFTVDLTQARGKQVTAVLPAPPSAPPQPAPAPKEKEKEKKAPASPTQSAPAPAPKK
jgi:hypothetical protein